MKIRQKNMLDQIPKKDVFKAPEDFFDTFYDGVESAIQEGEHTPKVPMIHLVGQRLGVAASVLILLASGLWFGLNLTEEPADYLAEVSDRDIIYYLESSEMDVETVLEALDPELFTEPLKEILDTEGMSNEEIQILKEQYEEIY